MDERVRNETGLFTTKANTKGELKNESVQVQSIETNRNSGQPNDTAKRSNAPDLICFSHLRWDFVFQRPQHLLTRAMKQWRVFFFEEPMWGNALRLEIKKISDTLWRVIPHVPGNWSSEEKNAGLRQLINQLTEELDIRRYISWYYTPMALQFSDHLKPEVTIYDCMDELSAFRGAPPQLVELEKRLMEQADVVLTGGQSLYEARQHRHPNIHPFPSSIERAHFGQARQPLPDPTDQRAIATPRIGFFGVLDERFDIDLLRQLADRRPDWQFVMLGPVVKIHPDSLPKSANIHYLGMKSYQELPSYICHWDVAILPFAINESTRFISPTKTPEYLAGGRPVVSTPIRDVIRPYGERNLVHIADTAEAFEQAIEKILSTPEAARQQWLSEVDAFLATNSWDQTWNKIYQLVDAQLLVKAAR